MDPAKRQFVRDRASHRCEYCLTHQDDVPFYRFHIEHIRPKQHEGTDDLDNLALACHHCNLNKGPNLTAIDPDSSSIVPLYHPRHQHWDDHFALQGTRIVGLNAIGRATARLLKMNTAPRIELRVESEKRD